jgi:hypothetical protein
MSNNTTRELRRIRTLEKEENLRQFGVRGHVYLNSTNTPNSNEFFYIEAWNSDALVSYTAMVDCNPVVYENITISDGRWILAEFSNITVHSGELIAYYK